MSQTPYSIIFPHLIHLGKILAHWQHFNLTFIIYFYSLLDIVSIDDPTHPEHSLLTFPIRMLLSDVMTNSEEQHVRRQHLLNYMMSTWKFLPCLGSDHKAIMQVCWYSYKRNSIQPNYHPRQICQHSSEGHNSYPKSQITVHHRELPQKLFSEEQSFLQKDNIATGREYNCS